jgi:hypothetical protein
MQIGATAARLLAAPGFAGEIAAVVSRAVYLWGAGGELLWLAPPGSPGHARSVAGAMVTRAWEAGTGFKVFHQALVFADGFRLDLSSARNWTPSRPAPGGSIPLEALRGDLARISDACHPFLGADGLGPALSCLTTGRQPGAEETVLTRMAVQPLTAVIEGCLAGDLAKIALAGRGLIGLGPGLTPAGDDFLGGLFFAAWQLQASYPGAFALDWRAVGELLAWAGARTNRISHALLVDLARGEGPAPLHDLIGLLLAGRGEDEIARAAQSVAAIGHTSGGDLLAGVLTGILLAQGAAGSGHMR